MTKRVTICAVIAVRNEAQYLHYLLPMLAEQSIDVVIIDNESTDGSNELYKLYINKPVIEVVSQPYRGFFSLTEQLELKKDINSKLPHDWLVHHDADEIMQHRLAGRTFRNAIEEADANGYNAINLEEFVFIPEIGHDVFKQNHFEEMKRYYFFSPQENRLNRAWKRSERMNNESHGGHCLCGDDIFIDPTNHILRHYIVKSEGHAKIKYLNRTFSGEDLAKGWHKNRLNFTQEKLQIPGNSPYLNQLSKSESKIFCRDNPAVKHFWEW